MTYQQTRPCSKAYRPGLLLAGAGLFMVITMGSDFLEARFRDGSFYFSESLLFSIYWLLFLPLLDLLWRMYNRIDGLICRAGMMSMVIGLHLLLYPAIVWIVSATFYNHTFAYGQTLRFGLIAYGIKTLIIYASSTLILRMQSRDPGPVYPNRSFGEHQLAENTTPGVLVSDSGNRRMFIGTVDILYFSANPPYVNVHLPGRKYLFAGTLRSLESQLNASQFIRIHKGLIVNLSSVVSFESRKNGDYDLTIDGNTVLRISRHYAPSFRKKLAAFHRLASK